MLEQVCHFIHNYFVMQTFTGEFQIQNGALNVNGLLDGQRFRIRGSALNDGIYTYTEAGILDDDFDQSVTLSDETFMGSVDYMGVPKMFLALCEEIKTWCADNAKALNSPYTSESFGGYSYTKASGTGANGTTGGAMTWQDQFRARLNVYRKIA